MSYWLIFLLGFWLAVVLMRLAMEVEWPGDVLVGVVILSLCTLVWLCAFGMFVAVMG